MAVISDIHGNQEALDRVLEDIDRSGVQGIFCLGDMIGYGPEPEAVVQRIRARAIPAVMGNHELAAADPKILKFFNPLARRSLQLTLRMLSEESLQYICGLPAYAVLNDCRFVHGFPPDSINTYLFQVGTDKLVQTFGQMSEALCFVGHTHILELISCDGQTAMQKTLCRGRVDLGRSQKHIVNVGSVGQPRDVDNHAKYVVWDSEKQDLEVRYVSYEIEAVVQKIIAAGLPEVHAYRLR